MKAYLEVITLKNDIITTSGPVDDGCNNCDMGCPSDGVQMGGDQ